MGRSQVTAMQAAYMAPSWARGPDSSPGMGCSVSASSVLVAFVSVCLLLVVAPASSIPVSNTTQFAAALQDPTITEIILDPTGTGVGGGTLILQGAYWQLNTFDIQPGRYLTIRSVNGNPTMLDLGNIPAILNINTDATLELRDLLLKNVATQRQLADARPSINKTMTTVYGMLTWPSFYGQPGANLRIYNTTQYFWSYTLFRRPDCNFNLAAPPPKQQQVIVDRGQQTYKLLDSGYTLLVESGLYRAEYPVFDYDNQTYLGVIIVNSENSQGYCVPTNSSANEVIAGLARAGAVRDSGAASNHVVAVAVGSAVGGAVLFIVVAAVLATLLIRRRRKRHGGSTAELSSLQSLPVTGMSPGSDGMYAVGSGLRNDPLETHLLHHSRLRRLGPLDEEQVEVGPLLGRGSFGRVYKGRWRSTLVAIKVVEHASVPYDAMTLAEQKIEREALLATSLAHPNIIATFKICRMSAGSALGTHKSGMSDAVSFGQRASGSAAAEPSGGGGGVQRRGSGNDVRSSGAESALGLYGGRPSRDAGAGGAATTVADIGSAGSNRSRGGGDVISGDSGDRGARLGNPVGSTGTAGSSDSFDPATTVIVDLPTLSPPESGVPTDQTKGSDSAQNNGGKRPGTGGVEQVDLELTPGEKEQEDDEYAIEERRSRLLETWCLMEYAEKGSLADALRVNRFKRPNGLPELSTVLSCLMDIASGMEYLHAAGILHGDLKPANVLLKSTSADRRGFICKLCDFGMSRLMDATQATHVSTQTYGTMPYMPPELLAHSQLTPQADVYSFGMVMWEIYTGQMPFANFTVGQVFFAVVHDHIRPPLDVFKEAIEKSEEERPVLEAYVALLQRCWAEKGSERPSFPAILSELSGLRAQVAQLRSASTPGGGRRGANMTSPFAQSPPATPAAGTSPTTSARPPPARPPPAKPPPVQPSAPAAEAGEGLSILRSPSFEAQQAGRPPLSPEESAGQPPQQ